MVIYGIFLNIVFYADAFDNNHKMIMYAESFELINAENTSFYTIIRLRRKNK